MNNKYLPIKWTVSRGRNTYGYNICTLWDGKQAYRCSGGGYDMKGTVLGLWLKANFSDRLQRLVDLEDCSKLYGIGSGADGKVYLDGACGLEAVIDIAKVIGVGITRAYNAKKEVLEGLFVNESGLNKG
jgi:hypothetical protein